MMEILINIIIWIVGFITGVAFTTVILKNSISKQVSAFDSYMKEIGNGNFYVTEITYEKEKNKKNSEKPRKNQ